MFEYSKRGMARIASLVAPRKTILSSSRIRLPTGIATSCPQKAADPNDRAGDNLLSQIRSSIRPTT
jgi:hypothetical protein